MTIEPADILLVEDSPEDRELTMRALTKRRLANNIIAVEDGAEALDFLFARGRYADRANMERPRLVLLDLKLPKVDGIEVLRQIRGDPRLHTMPVVALTSSSEQRDIVNTYDLGVNSFITKPVEFEDFQRAVEEIGMYWMLLNRPPIDSGTPA
jgi:CheY-like chemotaxis protein